MKPGLKTHLDPDFENYTYGDNCTNRRAAALLKAKQGDFLLFWGLLWKTQSWRDDIFAARDEDRVWALFGAFCIHQILLPGERLPRPNAHAYRNRVAGDPKTRVFIADRSQSWRFERPIDLGIKKTGSLLEKIMTPLGSFRWSNWQGLTRACRMVLDFSHRADQKIASALNAAVKKENPHISLFSEADITPPRVGI